MVINILLFNGFEALDVFCPVEVLSFAEENCLHYYSRFGGEIKCRQGFSVLTEPLSEADGSGVLLLPGGPGTRKLVNDEGFLSDLRKSAKQASYCLSVCTGSALYAKCGVLDGRKATSNKRAMEWAMSASDRVEWIKKARWVSDGKFYTSSGVSAGMDMTLAFLSDRLGRDYAERAAAAMEYIWNDDPNSDPFA